MPVISSLGAGQTMSDAQSAPPGATARPVSPRPARVWQAHDLLQPQLAASKFEANAWNASRVALFDVTDFSRVTDENESDPALDPSDRIPDAAQAEPDMTDAAIASDPLAAAMAARTLGLLAAAAAALRDIDAQVKAAQAAAKTAAAAA